MTSTNQQTGEFTSRISGFYKRTIGQRLGALFGTGVLSRTSRAHLEAGGRIDVSVADRMSENVIGCHVLPLSVALNFRINQKDVLVPMAVEEPSIVAAASNAARSVRLCGGFVGEADEPVMTAQVQLDDVSEPQWAAERLRAAATELRAAADELIPRMVARGGGCRDLDVRVLDDAAGVLVVHLYVAVGDAMGANLVDTVAEGVAPVIQGIAGGNIGLRILSNLPLRRMVRVRATISDDVVGGPEVADGITRASRFAELDPFRAATHNKGVMNAIDAVAVALGQDWRAIEAGAHAYAAMTGQYRPIAVWRRDETGLVGEIEMPMPAATVGGSTNAHAGIRAAFELVDVANARELAVVIAAAGLACNLAALRALASEGIQKGHMRLHHRKAEQAQEPIEEAAHDR